MRQDRTFLVPGPKPFASVDGQALNVATLADAVRKIMTRLDQGLGFTLFTLNLDHLDKRRADPAFKAAYARATFITADGAPVVALARRQKAVLSRATGADLIVPLCRAAAAARTPVFLFGSSDEALERAAAELRSRCPGLDVRGTEAPPLGFDPLSMGADAAGRRIAASGAKICFVALGAPKQEIFADRMASVTPGVGYLCIGAGLDFLAGEQQRAPELAQRLNLEWFWRMCGNPRRLGLRYMRCAWLYAKLLASREAPLADAEPLLVESVEETVVDFRTAAEAPRAARARLEIVHSADWPAAAPKPANTGHLRDASAAG